ncbi:Hsp70 family protein [Pseudonocardia sp.]|uniref:Hsp70 family protein n=1 Tax=Pseudonocardia sp. TaxID=60912 RepID=UPI00260BA77D|nr:Hsp70 family protein [Pseudonocardia sp.]
MTRWGLGVDLGTSFSAGAAAVDGGVDLLEVGGDRRVPSTVLLTEDGRLLAGAYAERMVGRLPDRAERNPRRYVGRAPMLLGGQPVSAVDALAAVLALFVQEGRRRHDGDPARIVLTHPAAWTPPQRDELREVAARVLPRADVELVAEPVAAAVHYAREHRVDGPVAVYDLGAGSVDTAVLAAERGGFRVLGTPGGDPDLGGEVFDQLVYRHVGEQLAHSAPHWWAELATNPERAWLAAAADLLTEARLAKEALSEAETTSRYVIGADTDVHVSRAELDALIGDDVRRSARILAGTLADTEPAAVFLTGGSSRTPLVERVLRDAHGDLVRTRRDPKSAVALGAAWRSLGATTPPVAPRTASPVAQPVAQPVAPGRPGRPDPALPRTPPAHSAPTPAPAQAARGLATLAEAVLDARVAAGRLYTWSAPDGPGGAHRIARVDPRTGRADHKIRLGRLVGWAVSAAGVVVAERRDGELRCHTLGRDLSVGATSVLPTPYRPFLLADGPVAWAVLRSPDTHLVDGQAPGETGSLAVQVFPLGARPGTPAGPVVALGPAVYRYADPARRFLDPDGPSSSAPALFGDGRSCAVITAHPHRQALSLVGPSGEVVQVAEQQPQPGRTPWAQQVLGAAGRWLLATSVGLESYADLRHGTDRRLFLPRPPGGAVRWVAAGPHAFGLAVDRLAPGRGFTLHVLVDGRRRELGRWPALLGSPAAARPDDAPRVRPDGPELLVGVADGTGGSHLVRADPDAARVLASAPGWVEPVGRIGDTVLGRHVPDAPPGDGCADAGLLVRLR